MKDNVHSKFLELIKKGALGTLAEAKCLFRFEDFLPVGSSDTGPAVSKMSKELHALMMKGPHPTINPIIDKISDYEAKNFTEAIELFIDENKTIERVKCDVDNDIVIVRVSGGLLAINCLPFFEQDVIKIEKASVQTALFRYDIEE